MKINQLHLILFVAITGYQAWYNYYLPTNINGLYITFNNFLSSNFGFGIPAPYFNLPSALGFGVIWGFVAVYAVIFIGRLFHLDKKGGKSRG